MNKKLLALAVAAMPFCAWGAHAAKADPAPKATLPLVVYAEAGDTQPWYASGYMGNHDAIKMDFGCTDSPHSGKTCIKANYNAGDQWAGVVWQNPANDWEAQKPGGWDLTGAKTFSFWAKGAKGGEIVTFWCGGDKGNHPYNNTAGAKFDKVTLTADWKQYSVDLGGKDLSRIKDGFGWVVGGQGAPLTFYLDDIKYE